MDKIKEIERQVLNILNAYALPPTVIEYENGKVKTISDGFIRDSDGKFKKIAIEISKIMVSN